MLRRCHIPRRLAGASFESSFNAVRGVEDAPVINHLLYALRGNSILHTLLSFVGFS